MIEKSQLIDGIAINYLGALNDDSLLVVVGRSNYKKSSSSIDSLIRDLHKRGLSVCWFENRTTQTSKLLEDKFNRLTGNSHSAFFDNFPILGNSLRKLTKALILLAYPTRWSYFIQPFRNPNPIASNDLRKFLANLCSQKIYLLSHSAGGISSSLIEDERSVNKLICFGYPFQHPDRNEEPYRTAHLSSIQKPFLIIQGNNDEYGNTSSTIRYQLSPSIQIAPIESNHDYDNLPESEYTRCLELIKAFLDV